MNLDERAQAAAGEINDYVNQHTMRCFTGRPIPTMMTDEIAVIIEKHFGKRCIAVVVNNRYFTDLPADRILDSGQVDLTQEEIQAYIDWLEKHCDEKAIERTADLEAAMERVREFRETLATDSDRECDCEWVVRCLDEAIAGPGGEAKDGESGKA